MAARLTVEVPQGAAGSRADRFVADASGLSRAYVQRLISEGRLTRDGLRVRSRDGVLAGSRLELDVPDVTPTDVLAESIPLTVVYEDADLLVVDKPYGMVTHPAPGHPTGTLVNALLGLGGIEEWGGIAGVQRPGIVHRLDRDTSGLLMVARNDAAQVSLQAQLKARRVHKTYLALASGTIAAQLGRIEAPIGRDPRHRTRMAVVPDGRSAITGYRVRERFLHWTLLEMDLITGRTHQIRVHLASIGHPIAGDPIYSTGAARRGPDGLERLFLHSWKLELVSPSSGKLVRATAPLPDGLEAVLERLREEDARPVSDEDSQVRQPPMLFVISGPSGVGKDTILKELKTREPARPRHYVVTYKSRAPRPGEVDGDDYHFVGDQRFAELLAQDAFLETAEVYGQWSGTPRSEVDEPFARGEDVVLKVDVQGARSVRQRMPDAITIFVEPESIETLRRQLMDRKTESRADLDTRLAAVPGEMDARSEFDFVVVNPSGHAEAAADAIEEIIATAYARQAERRIRA